MHVEKLHGVGVSGFIYKKETETVLLRTTIFTKEYLRFHSKKYIVRTVPHNIRDLKIDVYGKRQSANEILQLYYNSFYTSFEIY